MFLLHCPHGRDTEKTHTRSPRQTVCVFSVSQFRGALHCAIRVICGPLRFLRCVFLAFAAVAQPGRA